MDDNLNCYCDACALREACEYTFGDYWSSKSRNGIGCSNPTGDAAWSAAVLNAKRIHECAAITKPEQAEFCLKPATDPDKIQHRWVVTHKGVDRETVATSEASAINHIRFKLYGTTPMSELPPFSARMVVTDALVRNSNTGSLTKNEMAKRLSRMVAI